MSQAGEPSVTLLLDLHADLAEAPTWDERVQKLYFVDINGKKIYSCNHDASDLVSIDTPETVGTIALTTDETLLLAAMNRSVHLVDIASQKVGEAIATVPEEHGIDQMRFNDGKATPGGVFLVGRMHLKFAEGKPGRFYRLHWKKRNEGHFEELQGPDVVGLPNGLDWKQGRMFHADTYHKTITAYDTDQMGVPIRKQPGQPVTGRVAVRLPKDDGGPDGMCIDRDGNLWAALPESGQLGCYSPTTGQPVRKVNLPVKCPTACSFGGPNLDTLFVTTMKEGEGDQSEHWGGIFAVHIPGIVGNAPAYKVKLPR